MGDGQFSEEFLRRLEGTQMDDALLDELSALTTEERSELGRILIERKIRRAGGNGGH